MCRSTKPLLLSRKELLFFGKFTETKLRLPQAMLRALAILPVLCSAWAPPSVPQVSRFRRDVCACRFSGTAKRSWHARGVRGLAAQAAGDSTETELTNEQCEILDLPYGTKIVGMRDGAHALRPAPFCVLCELA